MIKFRCQNCGQKLAIDDEGAGAVISCTNCAENVVVPPETDAEFQPATTVALELVKSDGTQSTNDARLRAGLMPYLARWMMDKLVQALLSQRANLLNAQQTAALEVVRLEERLIKIQEQLQFRFTAYEKRVTDLEKELAAKEEENRLLIRDKFVLAKKALEAAEVKESVRVDLRDASFLLRT